ncbi:tRNA(His) guanylyltransferase 1 [Linum perenne]
MSMSSHLKLKMGLHSPISLFFKFMSLTFQDCLNLCMLSFKLHVRFCKAHDLRRPYDEKFLELMNLSAELVLRQYPDIVFSYGFNDEHSFVFKKKTKFHDRRASKILSIVTSCFTSTFVNNWRDLFSDRELKYPPSLNGQVIACATMDVLQHYLAWRQRECYLTNQFSACFWELVNHGRTEKEAEEEIRKGSQKKDQHEILLQKCNINYNDLPEIFRWGSCILIMEVETIVKYNKDGSPVPRLRKQISTVRSKHIARRKFWNDKPILIKELGAFVADITRIDEDYIKYFQSENKLMPYTWAVVRIDGCHFHRFSEVHQFQKPNDEQALMLMNQCAVSVLEKFPEVVFAYGVSDEYSFILKRSCHLSRISPSDIVSSVVSLFTSAYMMKWKTFFPSTDLLSLPSFDGRVVCYPSVEILRDYLSWRQVDCHINNQYNTCFWELVKSGKSKSEAQQRLKGTRTEEKEELLLSEFGIEYKADIGEMLRRGSSVFRVIKCRDEGVLGDADMQEEENGWSRSSSRIVVEHCSIIDDDFWESHPYILSSVVSAKAQNNDSKLRNDER